jgi:hypothetical protein
MLKLLKNKRAASLDNLFVVISFFGLAILFVALMIGWNAINSGLDDVWTGSSVGGTIQTNAQNAVNQFDWILMMVWVALHVGILITAYLLRTHPVVYVVAIFLTAILALVAAPLANAYEDMTTDAEMEEAIDDLPRTNFILDNFAKLEIIWCIVTIVVMFGLAKSEGYL